jgi:small subunit ribosomal protein S20
VSAKMANIKSAIKRAKKAKKSNLLNKMQKSGLKSTIKTFEGFLASEKVEDAKNFLPTLIKKIDKAAAKGLIHKKNAANKKSRFTKMLNSFKA